MNKIKLIASAVLNGIVKALPLSAYLKDGRELGLKTEIEKVDKKALLGIPAKDRIALFNILDLLDDGKMNNSINEKKISKLIEIGVSIATVITLIKGLL